MSRDVCYGQLKPARFPSLPIFYLFRRKRLQDYAKQHPTTATTVRLRVELMKGHDFHNFIALRRVFPSADQIIVASGNPVTIFDIRNHYRLITAVHYNRCAVFILLLLTHSAYDKEHWKMTL